ncbi:hypothetical protein BH24ACT5_BH24ACT5_10640 [soil metagenome]
MSTSGAEAGSAGLSVRLAAGPAGERALLDAAGRPNGEVLVALGRSGCRLLRPDSTVVVTWPLPTSRIVMSDDDASALIIHDRRSGEIEVRQVDLTTHRLRYYGTLRPLAVADSFDGTRWMIVDAINAAVVDLTAASPRIGWRPIESGTQCHALLRTPDGGTALVSSNHDPFVPPVTELRRWGPTMSGLTLRTTVTFAGNVTSYAVLPGGLLTVRKRTAEVFDGTSTSSFELRANEHLRTAGDLIARYRIDRPAPSLLVARWPGQEPVIVYEHGPMDESPRVRSHGDVATVWDPAGRIHVVNLATRTTLSVVRVLR